MITPCALVLASALTLAATSGDLTNESTKALSQRSADELVAITASLRTGLLRSKMSEEDRALTEAKITGIEYLGNVAEGLVRYRLTFGEGRCRMTVDIQSGDETPSDDVMIVAASSCERRPNP